MTIAYFKVKKGKKEKTKKNFQLNICYPIKQDPRELFRVKWIQNFSLNQTSEKEKMELSTSLKENH